MPERQYVFSKDFTGGIDTSKRTDMLGENQLSVASNIYFKNQFAQVDTGYTLYGKTVQGYPQKTFNIITLAGTQTLILVTTTTIYQLVSGAWHYYPMGETIATVGATTTTSIMVAGSTSLAVTSGTNFANGVKIGIVMDNGEQHETTVASGGTTTALVLALAIPVNRSVALGAAVRKGYTLTATVTDAVDVAFAPSIGYTFIVNNVDPPVLIDSATTSATELAQLTGSDMDATLGATFTAKTVVYFNDYLMFGNTLESTVRKAQRLRWCAAADPTDFNGTDAGYLDLVEFDDFIMGLRKLGPSLIAYKERTIMKGDWVGSVDQLINWKTAVIDQGIFNHNCVAPRRDEHIVFGSKSIFKYQGGFNVEEISLPIESYLYAPEKDINISQKNMFYATFVDELNEVWFFYVSEEGTYLDSMLRYNLLYKSWSQRGFDYSFLAADVYIQNSTIVLLSGSGKQIYSYDFETASENGATIDWELTTRDFFTPGRSQNLSFIDFSLKGYNILVELSDDFGVTYSQIGKINPGETQTVETIYVNRVTSQFRIRLTGNSKDFKLGWMGFEFLNEQQR